MLLAGAASAASAKTNGPEWAIRLVLDVTETSFPQLLNKDIRMKLFASSSDYSQARFSVGPSSYGTIGCNYVIRVSSSGALASGLRKANQQSSPTNGPTWRITRRASAGKKRDYPLPPRYRTCSNQESDQPRSLFQTECGQSIRCALPGRSDGPRSLPQEPSSDHRARGNCCLNRAGRKRMSGCPQPLRSGDGNTRPLRICSCMSLTQGGT
jgi:hypothetical protein